MCFKKWISDIKFLQNHGKLGLSMIFIGLHSNYDPKRSKNGQKRSKNDRKWSKMIKNDQIMRLICFKKWISDIKFLQKHEKLSLSMIFIGFHINYDPKRSKNGQKRSKMIENGQKWSEMIKLCD